MPVITRPVPAGQAGLQRAAGDTERAGVLTHTRTRLLQEQPQDPGVELVHGHGAPTFLPPEVIFTDCTDGSLRDRWPLARRTGPDGEDPRSGAGTRGEDGDSTWSQPTTGPPFRDSRTSSGRARSS